MKEVNKMADDINEIRRENYQLKSEVAALRAMIDGNYPQATVWLATKVDRQRVMLNALQKKGKGHTKEEREQATV
jgi:hypothetical protein